MGITALSLLLPIDFCVSSIKLRNMQNEPERPESTFARRMRELREAAGMPQSHIANVLAMSHGIKVDPTAITRIERGTRTIRLDEAVAIASVFDHTVDEILRPALSPEEQLLQAEQEIEAAQRRVERAVAEFEALQRRLEQLRTALKVGAALKLGADLLVGADLKVGAALKEVFAEGSNDGEHR